MTFRTFKKEFKMLDCIEEIDDYHRRFSITMKILLIQPEFPDTFWSFKHALKFISKKTSNPPLGLLTVAAMLPAAWEKKLIDLNINALKNEPIAWADYVFISAMNVQRPSVLKVLHQVKQLGKKIVAGGPLFTGEQDCYPEIDHFVLNEAEITLPEFLADLLNGTPKPLYQTGMYADITCTPQPMWELINFRDYDSMNIQFSRGCPYNCDFCNVTAMLGHKPRTKTARQLIAELDSLYQLGWRRNIFFVDDNFIGNKKILKTEILPELIKWRKGKKGCLFLTEASINLADDPDLIEMMVQAGFTSVFIGIETPDEASLAECNKQQNKNRDLHHSVNVLQRAGLQVMAGFIVGFDSDTPDIFHRQVEFIQTSGIVTAMVGLLQAPFGTDLYRRMLREGRLTDEMTGDNVDGSTNIIPKMDSHILMSGYETLLRTIYSPKMFYKRIRQFLSVYRPLNNAVHLEVYEILAFFRSIIQLGILGPERKYYWQNFYWCLFRHPRSFSLAITLSIYGHHFRKVSEKLQLRMIRSTSERKIILPQREIILPGLGD